MMKSRENDTGTKLEVNGQILDSCGKLMQTIKILITKARDLQKEIVAQGRVRTIRFHFDMFLVSFRLGNGQCSRILFEESQMDRRFGLSCEECRCQCQSFDVSRKTFVREFHRSIPDSFSSHRNEQKNDIGFSK